MAQADRGSSRSAPKTRVPPVAGPGAGVLWVALGLALVATAWAAFQWSELAAARAGGEITCAFGDGSSCAAAWNSPFARSVEGTTGLPVAGWGLLWGLLASLMPLGALVRRARGRSAEPWWSAARWLAVGGVVAAVGLAALLLGSGQTCGNCLITHGLVLAYALACLARGPRLVAPLPGAALAAGTGAIGFAVLLSVGSALFGGGGGAGGDPDGVRMAGGLAAAPSPGSETARETPPGAAPTAGDESARDRVLREYIQGLAPPVRQAIADAMASWARNPALPIRPPRALVGSPTAPVRITEFADALCSHCADLHRTLSEIRRRVPSDSLAIESRHFPLDGACNPQLSAASKDALRCTAARTMICLEGNRGAFDVASEIFENQGRLDEARIFAAARPYMKAEELRVCLEASETKARLQADIDWAVERGIKGTPLVLVNGREAQPLPPFLYALVLARGDPGHPAFTLLPVPRS